MMWYMGGKFKQSKEIVNAIRERTEPGFTYVEPFCGGMWSASRVCRDLEPGRVILADINESLVRLWNKCLDEGCDWLPVDIDEIESNYHRYKDVQDMSDPLTAWYGVACSFGGKWFGGVARSNDNAFNGRGFKPQRDSTARKVNSLNTRNVDPVACCQYDELYIPDGSMVYLDPPYEGRTKAYKFDKFDYGKFWQYVRDLSGRCTVITSCFDCPDDFETVYAWGDTVVRHNHSKGSDGTCERLVQYVGD